MYDINTWSDPTVALEISSANTIVGANLAITAAEANPIVARLDIDFTGESTNFESSERTADSLEHLIVLNLVNIWPNHLQLCMNLTEQISFQKQIPGEEIGTLQ